MAAPIPFTRGQNSTMRFFQDGRPVYLPAKNFDIEESSTEVADPVCGELRDRLDKVTNFFTGSVDIFVADETQMQMILDAQNADDAQGLPLEQSAAVFTNNRDGTRSAYALQEAKFGPWKRTNGGRADAIMINVKFRCRWFKPVKVF